ncbi:hypothetical protein [Caballeronia sp. M1242]|uniref:hypothetical protein n=1 Tax=Caballeronia sp. M1242 TaxID=2814653 RepID=UPI00353031C9
MKRAAERICAVALAALHMLVLPTASLAAGSETLAQIEARGVLRCGVSEGIAGFSAQDASGRWTGMDVDFSLNGATVCVLRDTSSDPPMQ